MHFVRDETIHNCVTSGEDTYLGMSLILFESGDEIVHAKREMRKSKPHESIPCLRSPQSEIT